MDQSKILPCGRLECSLSWIESTVFRAQLVEVFEWWLALVHVHVCPILWLGRGRVLGTLRTRNRRQAAFNGLLNAWRLLLALFCEVVELSIIIELIFVVNIGQLLKVDLVAQKGANATKSFHKLISFARSIRNKLQRGTKILVLFGKPF